MKLYYWKSQTYSNFGDELNLWLWPKLFPGLFNDDSTNIFLGIGTVLWDGYPQQSYKHVFGSGCGYGKIPTIDEKWIFHYVRGPKTAQVFNLPSSKVITDPAILIHSFYNLATEKKYKISFMPHHSHDKVYDFQPMCKKYEIHYISPITTDIDKVIDEIAASELVLAEAMHAAIIADALRVNWIPIDLYGINQFKWTDWCQSLQLEFKPIRLLRWPEHKQKQDKWSRKLRKVNLLNDLYLSQIFKKAINNSPTFLSNDTVFNSTLNRLWDEVEKFKTGLWTKNNG